jgi:hypothetical protein
MNITKNNTTVPNFEEILKKTKNLKVDTDYTFSIYGNTSNTLRVYLSRLADRGIIVKTGRGHFYKPSNLVAVKRSHKVTKLNKSLFTNDLFWNVKDGFNIKTDVLIREYLKNYSQDDLMGLYSLFGYTRLIEESLVLYKNRRNTDYQNIRKMLMQFEQWRRAS